MKRAADAKGKPSFANFMLKTSIFKPVGLRDVPDYSRWKQ